MWIRILLFPWWARALALACYLALVLAAAGALVWFEKVRPPDPWVGAIIGGLTLVLTPLMVASTQRAHDAHAGALEGVAAENRGSAIDAIWRGPLPADPQVRAAATRVAQVYLDRHRSIRWTLVTAMGLLLVSQAIALVDTRTARDAFVHAVLAALAIAVFPWMWYAQRRVARRRGSLAESLPQSGR